MIAISGCFENENETLCSIKDGLFIDKLRVILLSQEWLYLMKLWGYNYGIEVTFNGITSLLNFMKIYQLVQKLLGETD
jgi:hypothetical protein